MQKIAPQAKSEKYFQIWFFPPFGGKKLRPSEYAHASRLLSPARVQPLYGAGTKESSGTRLSIFRLILRVFQANLVANLTRL